MAPRTRNIMLPTSEGPLGQEEFLALCQTNASQLWDRMVTLYSDLTERIEQLVAEEAEAQLLAQQREGEVITAQQEHEEAVRTFEEIVRTLTSERDQYARQIAQTTLRGSTPSTIVASSTTKKSVKLPDPPELTDGKDPLFEDWLLLMTQKFSANADHYDTPELRIAYVASRTAGKARRHITPRMRDGSKNKYQDSKDMFEHLKSIYSDPNRVINAKHKFRQLFMKTTDKFHDFLSEFMYLAEEAEIPEDTWKDELYHKLTTKLQELTIPESIKPNGSFQEFSEYCAQTSNRLEAIQHRNQRNRTFNPRTNPTTTSSASSPAIMTPRSETPRTSTPKPKEDNNKASGSKHLTQQELEQYRKEGRCFNCSEHGHMKPDCPNLKVAPQLHAVERKRHTSEESSDKNDESGKDDA